MPRRYNGWDVDIYPSGRGKRSVDVSDRIIQNIDVPDENSVTYIVPDLQTVETFDTSNQHDMNVEGQNVDESQQDEAQHNHCLRTEVRTRCNAGPGRRIWNSGPTNVWDPADEEDFGEDPSWNCDHCCTEEGKSLPTCAPPSIAVDMQEDEGTEGLDDIQNVQYKDGWRVDYYINGRSVDQQINENPEQNVTTTTTTTLDRNISLTVCDSNLSSSNDWVWIEFNSNSQLNTKGRTHHYQWQAMGDCSDLELQEDNLEFRLITSKQRMLSWYDELKICGVKLNTPQYIFTWSGQSNCEGTGDWETLQRSRHMEE